ncbi:hypothetical protein STCU_06412 [Strigomonas culicis]|uniref:Uncharacterized protein n=1 Tax=Strigomonas culicis TaxID=28005 RepID=S9U529_9TRYP|nr:hypothetical protein STCU_06412 [Strigomonas culicis]|eukprot:EPY25917.1 hypothetical protein STCU_06412 [Strigomonas culicis]
MEAYANGVSGQNHPSAMYNAPKQSANISLENYKGILLCDPPGSFATGSDNGFRATDGIRGFVPAGRTGNPVGAGPSVEDKAMRAEHEKLRAANTKAQRDTSHKVLSRHRRWLRSFCQQMKEMKQADIDREVEAARRAARLRQAELQKRDVHAETCPAPQPYNAQVELEPFQASTKKAKKGKPKPQWAMTEDEAFDAEFDVNNDLLEFARNLDYDKFINDYEVTEALSIMRDRVKELARQNNWTEEDIVRAGHGDMDDDDADDTASTANGPASADGQQAGGEAPRARRPQEARAAVPGGSAEHDKEWDSSVGRSKALQRSIHKDALELAERLLASSTSMQKIHTKYSLARVLQQCALNGDVDGRALHTTAGGTAAGKAALDALASAGPVAEPKVVLVNADANTVSGLTENEGRVLREMQMSKERTQGLPYLYRCPAI